MARAGRPWRTARTVCVFIGAFGFSRATPHPGLVLSAAGPGSACPPPRLPVPGRSGPSRCDPPPLLVPSVLEYASSKYSSQANVASSRHDRPCFCFFQHSGKCRQGMCECRDMLTMLTSSVMARLQFSFRREMPRAPHKTLHRAQYRLVITISPDQTNPSTARTIHAPEHHNLRHHPPPQGVTQGESGTTPS